MSFTDFLENELIDHVFANAAYTAPTTLYVALFTTATSDTGSGTEVTGGAYARQSAAFTVTGNAATSTSNIEYPTATASYGTVTHVAVYDALTAGNMLAHAALTLSKTISTGDVFRINAGDLDITLD